MLPPIRPLTDLLLDQTQLIQGATIRLTNPLVHTNAGDLSRDFRRRQFWRNAVQHEPQAPILFGRYPEAYVTGTGPHILMCCNELAAEYIPTNYTPADTARRVAEIEAARPHPISIDEPVLYAAYPGLRIWGHWLLEMLPRIVLAERNWPGRFRYVLPADLAPAPDRFFNLQVARSLAACGVGPERVRRIEPGHLYRFSNLFDFSGMPGHAHAVHPALLHLLRAMPGLPSPGPRVPLTAILRSFTEQRGLSNHAEIAKLLRQEGAVMLDPNTAPFTEQVAAFLNADLIVGEMGSNLAGVLFARPETAIISLAPSGWDDGFLARLLQMTDAMHADIRGPSTAQAHDDMRTARYAVAPQAISDALQAMRTRLLERPLPDAVTVDGRSIARRMGEALLEIRFAAGGNAENFSPTGFSQPEENARWSDGPTASVTLHGFKPPANGCWLEIEGIGHEIPPVLVDTEVAILVNGEELARFDVGHLSRLQVPVPAEIAGRRTPIMINFFHPTCPPFGSVAPSSDMRRLGFFYQTIRVRRRG